MSYADIIDKIQRLSHGDDVCDDELCSLLLKSNCYYLLSKSPKYISKCTVPVTLNSIVMSKRYALSQTVFEKLDCIPYAHIKGAVLASRIYEKYEYRLSGDIDLLVSPASSKEVKDILVENGFIQGKLVDNHIIPFSRQELIYQKSFSHQLAPFVKETGNPICPFINIDVNLNIVWGEGNISIDIDEFVSHTEHFKIQGISIRCLKPVWEFISLCMHHYKDMNSIYLIASRGFKLSEYCDIYFYLLNVSPDSNELANISKQYGVSEYVFYCIYYANEIFADERLLIYLEKLNSESAQQLIERYGLTDSERRKWTTPFFERLLDNGFKERFYNSLNETDYCKIEINQKLM